ncbi:hypothetical protein Patl1_14376 [Pistacia atlantica]|uniref:Uncharacterized protein n=1 Tax=Pistacia atlantica TaxID=434234 RepID=A0ACC1AS53_9ROSI|nr:hypothetical protein Patl1_14376 [Pistacia atlantica]
MTSLINFINAGFTQPIANTFFVLIHANLFVMVRSRFLLLFLPSFLLSIHVVGIHSGAAEINVPIGAVLDLDSAEGATAEVSISMAIADFYATHS